MVVHSTSICFVCSHFAAGQNEIRDRNEDFSSAMRKIRFPQGREVSSNDVVFWFGDFNYRISMGREEVKRAVALGNYEELVPNDQLTQQRLLGNTFVGFEEGPLSFAPTYKYDTFSDDYDTSEKCRVPAWTDRILWNDQRGERAGTKLICYDRVELKTSDHRPVYAMFQMNAYKVDWNKCEELVEDVVACMGPPDGTVLCSLSEYVQFSADAVNEIIEKSKELGVQILTNKLDGGLLWLICASGECAIAALSMDGIMLRNGGKLQVELRSPNWCENVRLRIASHDPSIQVFEEVAIPSENQNEFIFEDEEEECATAIRMTPPERPKPPSRPPSAIMHTRNSTAPPVALADLSWPDEQKVVPFAPPPTIPPPRCQAPLPPSNASSADPFQPFSQSLSTSVENSLNTTSSSVLNWEHWNGSSSSINNSEFGSQVQFSHSGSSLQDPWSNIQYPKDQCPVGRTSVNYSSKDLATGTLRSSTSEIDAWSMNSWANVSSKQGLTHVSSVPNIQMLRQQITNINRPVSCVTQVPKIPPRPKATDWP